MGRHESPRGALQNLVIGLQLLDHETEMQDSYQLEVSSPGLERKLRRPSHFQKSVGREVKAKVSLGERNATLHGVITAAGEEVFTLEGDEGAKTFNYDDVITAKTVFRWEKAPKPGH